MKTFYPAGDEQTMVQQVTRRSVPERGLPLDVGCVVDNVGTLLNIQDALEGTPVTEKYLSVVGEVKEPILLKVPVGTALTACVAEARPNLADYALIVGGPMMGKPLTDRAAIEAAVVTKTTGNLIVLPKEHYLFRRAQLPMETIRHQTKSACIQCRMCIDLCPAISSGTRFRPTWSCATCGGRGASRTTRSICAPSATRPTAATAACARCSPAPWACLPAR